MCSNFYAMGGSCPDCWPLVSIWSHWWAKSPSNSAPIQGDHKNCQFLVQCKNFRKCARTFTPRGDVVQIVGPMSPSWSKSPSDSAPIQGDHQNCQFLVKYPDFRKWVLTLMPREEVVQIIGPRPPSWSYRLAKSPSDSAPIQGDHQNYQFLVKYKFQKIR